uniref:hypothetical protein n=1 Tax=Herbidospora sakaeratensis TaxID=564415 RepID=UPI000782F093|nr:hypothetical protein [Herbidospora sakaeratensis]
MRSDADDAPRFVVDETSFDFHGVVGARITDSLDRFNETFARLRKDGHTPAKPPYFENTLCESETELFEYLASESGAEVDRDVKFRFYSLIQKCSEWDDSIPLADQVAVAGAEPREAWSIAYATTMAVRDRGVACLALDLCDRAGLLPVRVGSAQITIYFLSGCEEIPGYWRTLFALENVAEADFFVLAAQAFPRLVFHESLTFRRFQGDYRDLREPVVVHLSVLNDLFLDVYAAHKANPRAVRMALAEQGCEGVSPDSPKTHANSAAMRRRDVEYAGRTYRCEWHMKIRPNVERIHFAFGGDLGDRILVGVFVDHLPT